MALPKTLLQFVPSRLVNFFGRVQFVVPILKPMLRWASASLTRGESVIRHGVGKGLKFDPQGGHPGFALGTSDPLEQEALAAHLRPGGVFYDIGANVGFFAVLGAHLVGRNGRVYAFEPFPETARIARANLRRNGFDHAAVVEAAVCNRNGAGRLILSSAHTNYHLPNADEEHDAREGITVRTASVDELVASNETLPPTVVMIDAEGAELSVLRGMRETIRRSRPVIVCEVHWQPPAEFLAECRDLIGGDEAYEVRRLDGQPVPSTPKRFHLIMRPVGST